MKLIKLSDLSPDNVYLRLYSYEVFQPTLLKFIIKNRRCSTFMYLSKGPYKYNFDDKEVVFDEGSILYVPQGSTHCYNIMSSDTELFQVEFDIVSLETNENVIFSNCPIVVANRNFVNVSNAFDRDVFQKEPSPSQNFKIKSDIYSLISYIVNNEQQNVLTKNYKKITPAIDYINNNYTQKIYVAELAKLCFLSESQLRRIFKSEIGMSPIEYKNDLCIKIACKIIKSNKKSISEIASDLGFDNLCFFSQIFKKNVGISPKQYSLKYKK